MSIDSLITNFFPGADPLSVAGNALVYGIFVMLLLGAFDYLFGWFERKVIARIHGRRGPTQVGKFGMLQNLADIVKLLSKEHSLPEKSDKLLFTFSVPLMVAMSIFIVLLLPLSPSLIESDLSMGLLVVFIVLSFMPLVIFVNGFASGNKFSAISAQRAVVMLLSYEIPLLMVLAAVGVLAGGYNIAGIVEAQANNWFVVLSPIGFLVFFAAMLVEMERPPFDMREADSELIAGWLTDMSAPYYALALFLDYTKVFLGSLLIAILFFGGWLGPVLPPVVWLMLKGFVIAFFVTLIRATFMRTRIDGLLRFGWLWLTPLAIVNLIITFLIFIK
jgi:NADH-quinone oxidoreductase subunit H